MSLSSPPVLPRSGARCAAILDRRDGSPVGKLSAKARMAKWALGPVLLTALLTPCRAHAEPPRDETSQATAKQRAAESERLAAQGFEAYKAGEYDTAIQFYNQALEAHPAAALYFNVARIFETKLSAPERAIEYYRKALKTPDVTEALEEKSIARIQVLTALLAQPNQPEGQAPPPGQGEQPESQPPPAERQPPPAERQPEAAAPDERTTAQRNPQKTIGYAVGITGLVAAGAGFGLGGWALVERNKARETCDGDRCTTSGGVDSMNTAHNLATASTITVAAGGALVAVGLGMVLFAPRKKAADQDSATTAHERPGRATGPGSVQLAVSPTSGGARLQLTGAFF